MANRYRTIMYRYFRESIRYGSHSRLSMLYDHQAFDEIAEAVLGVAVAAGNDQTDWCASAACLIRELHKPLNKRQRSGCTHTPKEIWWRWPTRWRLRAISSARFRICYPEPHGQLRKKATPKFALYIRILLIEYMLFEPIIGAICNQSTEVW